MPVSDRPWGNYTAADYADANAYCDACLIDLNPAGKDKVKELCKLPVYEPRGALSRGGVHAAASVLAGGRGGVDAPPEAKRAAARKIMARYHELKEEAPDSIMRMAGG